MFQRSMIDTKLSYLLNNVHDIYPSVRHPVIDGIVRSIQNSSCHDPSSIFDFGNMLLYGHDTYMIHMYIRYLIQRNFDVTQLQTKSIQTVINQCDITYLESHYFLEMNLSTHLNKEKSCYIDLIKMVVSSKSVVHKKHLIVLLNFDMLSHVVQNRLRRIIEKSQDTSMFIIQCQHINKIIPELQSRFFSVRVAKPDRKKGAEFVNTIVRMHTNGSSNDDIGNTVFDLVADGQSSNASVVNLYMLFLYTLVYLHLRNNSVDTINIDLTKHLQRDVIVDDLSSLFDVYKKNKNPMTVLSHTRDVFFRILHYNISPSIIAHTTLTILKNDTRVSKKQHELVHILSEFEYACLKVNACKMLHCCEKYFIDIYCMMNDLRL